MIIVLAIPLYLVTKEMYDQYSSNKRYEEWYNYPVIGEHEVGKDLTVSYSKDQNNLFKYKLVIPKNGSLLIESYPYIPRDLLILELFNSKKPENWLVGRPTESGNGLVMPVKENEIYFLLIDQTELNKSGTGSYIIKTKITNSR